MDRGPRYWAKLVFGNLAVFFVVLCAVNFVAAVLYDARELIEEHFVGVSEKAYRTSVTDRARAEKIFSEFSRLQTRYVPYVEWKREPFRGETTNIGEDGDRITPPTTDHPVAHARFFGGSTMWGKGVDDGHTIPVAFNRLYPELAVNNHGESGYVSRQSLERLINIVAQGEPADLVVFYDGCNDFYTLCRTDTSLNGHSRENELARKFRPPSMMVESVSGALREIVFWAWGRSLKTTGPGSRCRNPEGAEAVAKNLLSGWRIAKRVADEAGAEFHAILQPVAVVGSPDVDYLGYLRDSPAQRLSDYEAAYPVAQRMIRESGERWMHDFTDVFDGKGPIFIDACHVNARGNELVAQRMEERFGAAWAGHVRSQH